MPDPSALPHDTTRRPLTPAGRGVTSLAVLRFMSLAVPRYMALAVPRYMSLAVLAAMTLAGCGRSRQQTPLTFEHLADTSGVGTGPGILESLEPSRMANGAVRVRGEIHLPDSTRIQIAIRKPAGVVSVAMAQVIVLGGGFDTPPLLGDSGPLPRGRYRLEVSAHFNADWQSARVLRETATLHGTGMTRARNGDPTLVLSREASL